MYIPWCHHHNDESNSLYCQDWLTLSNKKEVLQTEDLIRKFEEIQGPFEKHKPPDRKNFLSYHYCLYKFCQELGQEHILDNLKLLKNREKLYLMDKIYSKICADLGWKFVPSV